jgi:hypothetical protein
MAQSFTTAVGAASLAIPKLIAAVGAESLDGPMAVSNSSKHDEMGCITHY